MKKYNIIMIGHVSKDIMIYRGGDEKEERFTGGPVIYSSASAARAGADVLVVTKAAKEDWKDIQYIEDEKTDVKIIESKESTSIENIYLTEDRERRKVTLISQADYFTTDDVPSFSSFSINLSTNASTESSSSPSFLITSPLPIFVVSITFDPSG